MLIAPNEKSSESVLIARLRKQQCSYGTDLILWSQGIWLSWVQPGQSSKSRSRPVPRHDVLHVHEVRGWAISRHNSFRTSNRRRVESASRGSGLTTGIEVFGSCPNASGPRRWNLKFCFLMFKSLARRFHADSWLSLLGALDNLVER